jgi:hypothetical protein
VSSSKPSEPDFLDLASDVATTAGDVEVLRRLRRETPTWLSLSSAEIDALIPDGALRRKPLIRADARPFTFP